MKTQVEFFSTQKYDRKYFDQAIKNQPVEIEYLEAPLNERTAQLVDDCDVVCIFVNDVVNATVVEILARAGVKLLALRCAGFNNVDLKACEKHNLAVVRVPEYSPHSVAEHTFGLILTLNRKIHKAFNRVREGNFSLEGLCGFDLFGKTIGLIGCGSIGAKVTRIAHGFGMTVLMSDPKPNVELEKFGDYTDLATIFRESDIVTLHCPLNDKTFHLIDDNAIEQMKTGAMLVNSSRGALLDTTAVIRHLKSAKLGALAIDVYEEEANMFFHDRSDAVMKDDVFARLLTFPNVLITGHQAFFTHEAMTQIAETTVSSILALARNERLTYSISAMAS